jgi:hypothetical protein
LGWEVAISLCSVAVQTVRQKTLETKAYKSLPGRLIGIVTTPPSTVPSYPLGDDIASKQV